MLVKDVPQVYQDDIQTAVNILKQAGCAEVYLFGSLVTGNIHESSDIDLGIKGLPPEEFFKTYSKLYLNLSHKVDLVDFDDKQDFHALLERFAEVKKIA
jgi:predicted nucleotidyltransferase